MGIFKKIFGSVAKKEVAGDAAVVSALLQSIAVGAEPKTQVEKIRAIVGDSDTTFSGYLEELAMAGDEKPEVVAKAVDIVDNYYRTHLAGDESKACPKCGKEPCVCDKTGDEQKPEEKDAGDEQKPEEKKDDNSKSMGDAIDYDLLASKVTERMLAAQTPKDDDKKTVGDEKPAELSMPLGGDEKPEVRGSDDFMKDIWG